MRKNNLTWLLGDCGWQEYREPAADPQQIMVQVLYWQNKYEELHAQYLEMEQRLRALLDEEEER